MKVLVAIFVALALDRFVVHRLFFIVWGGRSEEAFSFGGFPNSDLLALRDESLSEEDGKDFSASTREDWAAGRVKRFESAWALLDEGIGAE